LGGDNTGGGFDDSTGRRGDDSYGSSGRTGGGLGQDDTYGSSTKTGGIGTDRDDNFGVGSGRTGQQEYGGVGAGGDRNTTGGYDEDGNRGGDGKSKDSTAGKLMEKAGSLFKSGKLEEKGAEKRRQAGGDDNY